MENEIKDIVDDIINKVESININSVNASIYEIINRSKYSETMITLSNLYISNPIIGKESCWNPLGGRDFV